MSGCPSFCFRYINRNRSIDCMEARGIRCADSHARFGRENFTGTGFDLSCLEYPFLLYSGNNLIVGDYRRTLDVVLWEQQITKWRDCRSQGLFPRTLQDGMRCRLKRLHRIVGSRNRFEAWFLDTCILNLPTFSTIFYRDRDYCFLCHRPFCDNTSHFLICPSVHIFIQRLLSGFSRRLLKNSKFSSAPHGQDVLKDQLTRCFSHILRRLPSISQKVLRRLISAYWQNLVIQRSVFSYMTFKMDVDRLSSYVGVGTHAGSVFPNDITKRLLSGVSHSMIVVPSLNSLPDGFHTWSFFDYNDSPCSRFQEQRWYDTEVFHEIVFLFQWSRPDLDFTSFERDIVSYVVDGGNIWFFIEFGLDNLDQSLPPGIQRECTFFEDLQTWRCHYFNGNFLYDRCVLRPAVQHIWDLYTDDPSDPFWLFPFFGKYRVILSLPSISFPMASRPLWSKFRKFNELGILLGFCAGPFGDAVETAFGLGSRFLEHIPKTAWRHVRDLYRARRASYNHLRPWIEGTVLLQ